MGNLALFFFNTLGTNSIATTRKVIAIDAGNSGIEGEGLIPDGEVELVDVRIVGVVVVVEL